VSGANSHQSCCALDHLLACLRRGQPGWQCRLTACQGFVFVMRSVVTRRWRDSDGARADHGTAELLS
jgi:hypothetical protein